MYSAGEVAGKLSVSKDTLRYYEREGLIPAIQRDSSGHRVYSEEDVDWLFLILRLRETDMPISKIKSYVSLLAEGGDTISSRREILVAHQEYIHHKIETYQQLAQLITQKIAFYDQVMSEENNQPSCMHFEEEWQHFKSLLGGSLHD